ncbi:hypothetical protein [Sphingomonas sp.]|jgi:hypothetical protein|uniref:hypothetical protein n=1 Tax=Sphingomonas sp. TaxID=28214 RepID=UPI002DE7975F|nr:hypothetical protein [Sphingomonas sp.]
MRLRDWEVEAIRSSAHEVFGPEVTVRLFGSRVDDRRRGGDIDLFLNGCSRCNDRRSRELFARLLQKRLGEREIDIVYATAGSEVGPIQVEALKHGVIL